MADVPGFYLKDEKRKIEEKDPPKRDEASYRGDLGQNKRIYDGRARDLELREVDGAMVIFVHNVGFGRTCLPR